VRRVVGGAREGIIVCLATDAVEAVLALCNALKTVNEAKLKYKMRMCLWMIQGYILGG